MSTIATAYVQIEPSTKGMKNALSEQMGGEAESAGKKSGSKFMKAFGTAAKVGGAAVAAAGAAFGKITKDAIASAGELEQNLGGSEAVFQEYAETIQTVASDAYSKMGLSQSEYLSNANKMGSLLQGSGFDIEDSMNTAVDVMQRASDVASIMGIDVSSAMEAVTGAAKGNFTMMDNLGVAINDTTLKLYAEEKGLGALETTQDKVSAAMQLFMEKTAQYAGNYAKENETYAGSIATLQASWDNFLSGAGDGSQLVDSLMGVVDAIMPMIQEIIPRLTESLPLFVDALGEIANQILPFIPPILSQLITSLVGMLPTLLPQIIDVAVQLVQMVAENLPMILEGIVQALVSSVPVIVEALPSMVIAIVEGLIQCLPILIEGLIQLIGGLVQALPEIIMAIVAALPEIIGMLVEALLTCLPQLIEGCITLNAELIAHAPEIIMGIIQAIPQIIMKIVQAIVKCAPKFVECAKTLVQKFGEGFKKVAEIGKNIIVGLWNGINNAKEWIVGKIKGFCQSALGAIKEFFGIHSPSKVMADEVGRFLPEGIAVGITANADSVTDAMDGLGNDMTATMQSRLSNMGSSYAVEGAEISGADGLYNLLSTYLPIIAENGNITLQGDASKLFKVMRKQDGMYKKSTGSTAFA